MLWFAWKIVLLQYRKQLPKFEVNQYCVVICLKNRTFAVSQTTNNTTGTAVSVLWFAWKIVLLQYRKQRLMLSERCLLSCDLLEKSYFCSIANNLSITDKGIEFVVICLKNRTFAVSQTTLWNAAWLSYQLWFAWKIVLLQYRKQPVRVDGKTIKRCDLLEKSYFCSIANNK